MMSDDSKILLDQLPDLVLIEIFKFLKPKDRLKTTEVCKRFNRIISKSPQLMDDIAIRVQLKNVGENNQKLNAIVQYFYQKFQKKKVNFNNFYQSDREYKNIKISYEGPSLLNRPLLTQVNAPLLKDLLKNIGSVGIKRFEVANCNIDANYIGRILTLLPNLETLEIIHADYIITGGDDLKISLPKLKTLKLNIQCFSDPLGNILRDVRNLEEISLKISLIGNRKAFSKFMLDLAKQKILSTMKIRGTFSELIFSSEFLEQVLFRLSTLELSDGNPKYFKYYADFLETQDKLESLAIGKYRINENAVNFETMRLMKTIFNLEHLTELDPPYQYNPLEYNKCCPKIEKLSFELPIINSDEPDHEPKLEKLVSVMPNLKKLIIKTNFKTELKDNRMSALNKLKKLRVLKIYGIHYSFMTSLNLEHLRKLEVSFLHKDSIKRLPDDCFIDFLDIHWKLRKIVLHQAFFSEASWNFIENILTQLEILKFSFLDCRNSGYDKDIEKLLETVNARGKFLAEKRVYGPNCKYGVYVIRKIDRVKSNIKLQN